MGAAIRARAPVVFIRTPSGSTGVGFIIDAAGTVVTNSHVVGDAGEVAVRTSWGIYVQGAVVQRHPSADLALLRLNDQPPVHPISLGKLSDAPEGAEVAALGFGLGDPLGKGLAPEFGTISDATYENGVTWLKSTVPVHTGNRGAPLVTRRDTEESVAVGVLALRVGGPDWAGLSDGASFAIAIEFFNEWMRRSNLDLQKRETLRV